MNSALWHLRQVVRPLGLAGVAGITLGVIALILHLAVTLPLHLANAAADKQLDTLRQQATVSPTPADTAIETDPLAQLPPTGDAAQQIGDLEHLARAHDITLPRGQYSATPQTGTRLVRWQVVLPVETDYPSLLAWLAAALERLPNLTLDELKLKRERIESRTLQAQLRLSLYVETPP